MKFADFHAGQTITHGPATLDAKQIASFAKDWDPQWFHTDPQAAAQGRFGGVIASGWQTCALAMRLAVECALADSESFASPGLQYVKWLHPVRAGDALTLHAEVLETRRSRRRGHLGILRWRWRLLNQNGAEVLDLEATSLFDLGRGPNGSNDDHE